MNNSSGQIAGYLDLEKGCLSPGLKLVLGIPVVPGIRKLTCGKDLENYQILTVGDFEASFIYSWVLKGKTEG